eukprot:TRINITY_DN27796_c0_g1_i1.p1 TRINITY_DN27796_c0_g1~~TRINITY_DN27796_c0_g1_i1.p1  ORF type:complete len:763 (+),score=208.02 TRINITY_DN27796_c0_g1_i1:103-2289(+)
MDPILHTQQLQWEDVVPVLEAVDSAEDLKSALADPQAFLDSVLAGAGPAGRKLLVAQLRPLVEPWLQKQRMRWQDLRPALELIKSFADLQKALTNPQVFLDELATCAAPASKKLLVAQLRPVLTPLMHKQHLTWQELQPLLELVDSQESLTKAIAEPGAFLAELASSSNLVGKKLLIAQSRKLVEPHLLKRKLEWQDVLPVLESINSGTLLKQLLDSPDVLLDEMVKLGGTVARKVLLAQMRPIVEPILQTQALLWQDVKPALELVQSIEDLRASLDDMPTFLEEMAKSAGPSGKRFLIAQVRSVVEPVLRRQGLTWQDILPGLELVDNVDELKLALADPERFFEEMIASLSPAARTLFLARLRPLLLPVLHRQGIDLQDVLPALQLLDLAGERRKLALADPEAFLKELRSSGGLIGKKLLIAELHTLFRPILREQRLAWEDVLRVLELVDSADELRAALADPAAFLQELAATGKPAGSMLLIAQVRPCVEPLLWKQGLSWQDLVPVLELLVSGAGQPSSAGSEAEAGSDLLRAAMSDPEALLLSLAEAAERGEALGRRFLIAQVHSRAESYLHTLQMQWQDVVPVLELVDSTEALKAAIAAPMCFFEGLAAAVTHTKGDAAVISSCSAAAAPAAGRRFLIARSRPLMEQQLRGHGVRWEDASRALENIDAVEEFLATLDAPGAFAAALAKTAASSAAAAAATAAGDDVAAVEDLEGAQDFALPNALG